MFPCGTYTLFSVHDNLLIAQTNKDTPINKLTEKAIARQSCIVIQIIKFTLNNNVPKIIHLAILSFSFSILFQFFNFVDNIFFEFTCKFLTTVLN